MPRRKLTQKGFPWHRKHDDCWYVTDPHTGRQRRLLDGQGHAVRGLENETRAIEVWHQTMVLAGAAAKGDGNEVAVLLALYLEHLHKHADGADTYGNCKVWFESFCKRWPGLLVKELRPKHVRTWWEEAHPKWADSTRYTVGSYLRAAFNWAQGEGADFILKDVTNPLKGMSLPAQQSRGAKAVVEQETVDAFVRQLPAYLQDILSVLWETGTRPSNLCRARVPNLDEENGCLVFAPHNSVPEHPIHKTFKRTREPLAIPLPDKSLAICKRLKAQRLAEGEPEGYLFKDRRGLPIKPKQFSSLTHDHAKRRGLKGKIFNYAARHTRATEMVEDGFTDMEVAKNHGLRDGRMVFHHYGHLGSRYKKLRENINRHLNGRRRPSPDSGSPAPPTPSEEGDGPAPSA